MAIRAAVIGRLTAAFFGAASLAACTTLSLGTAAKLQALDYLNDDIAGLVFALDLPAGIEPIPNQSGFAFDVTTAGKGEKHVKTTLTLADADTVDGALKPPGSGRTYYLVGFSEADKSTLRAAQAWARTIKAGGTDPQVAVTVTPRFCANVGVDPAKASFSVLVALPGANNLEPLTNGESFQSVVQQMGVTALSACAGHSG
jgi:hypothetical protein